MTGGGQLGFTFRTWGGKRRRGGRPPNGETAGVSHLRREPLKARFPLHVTWRMRDHVWNLRAKRCLSVIQRAFLVGRKDNFQVVHYAVMGNHVHMLVEADDNEALSRGMQGLAVRVVCALQQVMGKRGSVFKDRFHSRVLRSPTEVKYARLYILNNARHHFPGPHPAVDHATSQAPVHPPRTWLVSRTC